MATVFGVIGYLLFLYIVVLEARICIEWTRVFARAWRPAGTAAVGLEVVYMLTDPPIKALRRLVPPLQIGSISLDLSIYILFLAILALYWVASSYS